MSVLGAEKIYSVLLVDDNPGDLELARTWLHASVNEPLELICCESLQQALAILKERSINIIVLDLHLTDSSGVDTILSIKSLAPESEVVALTGSSSRHLRVDAISAGACDVINKNELPAVLLVRSVLYLIEKIRNEQGKEQILRLVRANPDAIIVVDERGIVQFVNDAALELFGKSNEDFVGELIGFSLPENHISELTLLTPRGQRTAELRVVSIEWSGRPAFLATIRDITDQRSTAEQLQQAIKMEAIGRLAGGVAHDFNNMLTVINGYSEMLIDDTALSEESRMIIREIHKSGMRAAALTRKLLDFSRKTIVQPASLSLNALISDIEPMLQRLLGEDIHLHCRLEPGLPNILIDPSQIEQVLLNLAANSRDAMPRGGYLSIETSLLNVGETPLSRDMQVNSGAYLMLSFTDNGSGMSTETMRRVFEPFYTTKPPGKGTGLGLSTVYGVVKQYDGHIGVESELGRGTTFRVYLPVQHSLERLVSAASKAESASQGSEIVLVVEDEDSVREYCRSVLELHGYQVETAAEASEALEIAARLNQAVDILVTDVVMPNIGGYDLTLLLRDVYPGLPVIYMSGYTDDAVIRHGVLTTEMFFLQKPFTAESLARLVRKVLDQAYPLRKYLSA